jgi:hypothetical protein
MATVFLSPWFNETSSLNGGLPNNGGSVTIFLTGTTTPAAVYVDELGVIANTNPVMLNSQGYPVQPIWLDITHNYDAIVKDALGNVIYELDYIGIPPANPALANDLGVWIDTLVNCHNVNTHSFTIAGVWDVIFTAGRRLKFYLLLSESPIRYGAVETATYNGGTNLTTVVMRMDGTSTVPAGTSHVFYSVLDSINVAVPKINYFGINTGTEDAIVVNFNPAFVPADSGTKFTIKCPNTNTTTTPTIAINGATPITIVKNGGGVLGIGDIPQYAEFVYDIDTNNAQLLNTSTTSNDAKWSAFPIGYTQPFIPAIMGTTLAAWLATHTDWAELNNTYVVGIEGCALAVASATHLGQTIYGNDDLVVPSHTHDGSTVASHNHAGSAGGSHTHAVSDPGHGHNLLNGAVADPSNSFSGTAAVGVWLGTANTTINTTGISISAASADVSIAYEAPAVTIATAGVSGTNANIQRTVYFDYICKIA